MQFDYKRYLNLLQLDFMKIKRLLLFAILGQFGLIGLMMWSQIGFGSEGYLIAFSPLLLISIVIPGCIVAALSFYEFNTEESRLDYLSLPSSTLEKFLSKWTLTFLGFILISTIVFILSYTFFSNFVLANVNFLPLIQISVNPSIQQSLLDIAEFYILGHSIFFVLSIVYNKYSFLKSAAFVVVLAVAYTFFVNGVSKIVYSFIVAPYSNGNDIHVHITDSAKYSVFIFIAAIILWIVAYLKLQEKQL